MPNIHNIALTMMHNDGIQHTGAVLASTTIVSFLAQWSPLVTWVVGGLAVAWYAVLFYDRFVNKKKGPID